MAKMTQAQVLGRPDTTERLAAHKETRYPQNAEDCFRLALTNVVRGYLWLKGYEKSLLCGRADYRNPDKQSLYAIETYAYDKQVLIDSLKSVNKEEVDRLISTLRPEEKQLIMSLLAK